MGVSLGRLEAMDRTGGCVDVVQVSYSEPEVAALILRLQAEEYVVRYGGWDETPVTEGESAHPRECSCWLGATAYPLPSAAGVGTSRHGQVTSRGTELPRSSGCTSCPRPAVEDWPVGFWPS